MSIPVLTALLLSAKLQQMDQEYQRPVSPNDVWLLLEKFQNLKVILIRELHRMGFTIREISFRLGGTSHDTVHRTLKQVGEKVRELKKNENQNS